MESAITFLKTHPFVMLVSLTLGGALVGYLIEKILIAQLRKVVERTAWEWDDSVLDSIKNMIVIWGFTVGLYATTILTKVDKKYKIITNKVVTVVIIATVTIILARLSGSLVKIFAKKTKGLMPSTTLFNRTTSILVYSLGIFIILQNLNIEITPLLTALGVGGLAVALALQDTLGNLFAGIQIIVTQQVRPGDYVKLDSGVEGYVTDIKGRNSTIRSFPNNNLIIIPNSTLVSSIVTNYNMPQKQLWASIDVGVAYDSDLEFVEKVTVDVAKKVSKEIEGGVAHYDPVMVFHTFGDSSINFTIRIFVNDFASHFKIKHEFIKALHKRYNEENIEIPFPIRTVYMKNAS